MKTILIALAVVSVLAAGTVAFGHGFGGWSGGHMMGQGYGGHMMGPGYGGHMMRGYTQDYGTDTKFLDETTNLRKDLHEKRFEYFEAQRDPKTSNDTLAKLEKEIRTLQDKIYEKAPRTASRGSGGYGHCF